MMDNYESVPSRTAVVLYGTETGTSQDLAYETGRILERYHFTTDVEEFDQTSPPVLAEYTLTVFVLSTTGQGEFPTNARSFWTNLRRKKLPPTYLQGVEYTLVGLGDSSYPKFNWAARLLHKRIQQLGALPLLELCEADEQGEDSTDGAFLVWSRQFQSMLEEKFPLPSGKLPIGEGTLLPSKWVLSLSQPNEASDGISLTGTVAVSSSVKSNDDLFKARLVRNDRVTPSDHWQDVRFIKLAAESTVEYYPGDALAIRPMNMPDDVQEMISLMGWEPVADKTIYFQPQTTMSSRRPFSASYKGEVEALTLRRLLTEDLDIKAIPRRSFFAAISHYTDNEMQKERLQEFTDPQYLDEYYDYATRPRRSILEILQEFDTVKIPWFEAFNVFPLLRPRLFSIASGGNLKVGGTNIELLVAIVKYKTVIKRIREGVCSKYLAQLPIGTVLNVSLRTEGRLHTPMQLHNTEHLLVGAGTGIAPLRAVIHEKRGRSGPSTLVFGCRNANSDYFFKDEWNEINQDKSTKDSSSLKVVTAFSRDQKQKFYIQDRIREQSELVRALLLKRNAIVVVCGSSGPMPKAVRQSFVDVLTSTPADGADGLAFTVNDAERYLSRMEKDNRYKQETW